MTDRLIESAVEFNVLVVGGEEEERPKRAARVSRRPLRRDWLSYLIALAATALATGIGLVIDLWLPIADITVVYLLAVLIVAIKSGLRAAITASFASFLVFNFVFTDPRWTFSIDNTQHALTIVLFLVAAVIVSNLASRARAQVEALGRGARRTSNLYDFSSRSTAAATLDDVLWAVVHHVAVTIDGKSLVLMPKPGDQGPRSPPAIRRKTASTTGRPQRPSGHGCMANRPVWARRHCRRPTGCSCR